MSIVVTGATGHLGRLVIESLLTADLPAGEIAAVARDTAKVASLAVLGVDVRIADYNSPSTLAGALRAGDLVLFVSGNETGRRVQQHRAVIEAARAAGVAQLAYTGVLGGPDADFETAADHKVTEQLILDSGLPYTFLRNGWYTENYTEHLAPVLERGSVVAAVGEGRVASAAWADFAAAAAAVLTGEGHLNKAYELCGDTAWSFAEYSAELTRQTGRTIVYNKVSGETLLGILTDAGVSEPMAAVQVGVDKAIERGRLVRTTGDLSRLAGRPTTPLAQSIAEALKF